LLENSVLLKSPGVRGCAVWNTGFLAMQVSSSIRVKTLDIVCRFVSLDIVVEAIARQTGVVVYDATVLS